MLPLHAFVRRTGPDVLLNPRRYGAMTWGDHARQRLSVFTREESVARHLAGEAEYAAALAARYGTGRG